MGNIYRITQHYEGSEDTKATRGAEKIGLALGPRLNTLFEENFGKGAAPTHVAIFEDLDETDQPVTHVLPLMFQRGDCMFVVARTPCIAEGGLSSSITNEEWYTAKTMSTSSLTFNLTINPLRGTINIGRSQDESTQDNGFFISLTEDGIGPNGAKLDIQSAQTAMNIASLSAGALNNIHLLVDIEE